MSKIRLYVEGGGDSKEMHARCREGFRKLIEKSGLKGRVPHIVACGGRNDTFDSFKTANQQGMIAYMLVDSEDPVSDGDKPWEHLKSRDNWIRPDDAEDEQVFLMTTCMETWIITDRLGLAQHFRNCIQVSALPALTQLEERHRHAIQDALMHATRNCSNRYAKNKRSFEVLVAVSPETLQKHLPAFARMIRILDERLP